MHVELLISSQIHCGLLISCFSVSPWGGFSCLNCGFAGNLYGCGGSPLCLQSGKAEPGVGWEGAALGTAVGTPWGSSWISGRNPTGVFPPPWMQMSLSIASHPNSFLPVPPGSWETHPR